MSYNRWLPAAPTMHRDACFTALHAMLAELPSAPRDCHQILRGKISRLHAEFEDASKRALEAEERVRLQQEQIGKWASAAAMPPPREAELQQEVKALQDQVKALEHDEAQRRQQFKQLEAKYNQTAAQLQQARQELDLKKAQVRDCQEEYKKKLGDLGRELNGAKAAVLECEAVYKKKNTDLGRQLDVAKAEARATMHRERESTAHFQKYKLQEQQRSARDKSKVERLSAQVETLRAANARVEQALVNASRKA